LVDDGKNVADVLRVCGVNDVMLIGVTEEAIDWREKGQGAM